jgi:hypothetical protein
MTLQRSANGIAANICRIPVLDREFTFAFSAKQQPANMRPQETPSSISLARINISTIKKNPRFVPAATFCQFLAIDWRLE